MDPQYQASIDFLKWWRPEGPWSLVAIEPDNRGNIQGASFTKDQVPAMQAWLEKHGKVQNLYFSVNPMTSLLQKKPERTDVLEMAWLHLDVDPKPGLDLDAERKRILELVSKHEPTPSCIIDSGGGYQAFWRLETPVPIGGSLDRAREAATWNLQLESEYWNEGADACHNIDRIMRLPGTINRPDAKKREKGRIPRVASVVWAKDLVYPISKFLACPMVASPSETVSGERVEVNVSGNIRRTEDLNLLPVSPLVRVVIAQGCDPDNPTRWSDRSDPLFWVCCEMVRAEVDDETIYGIITDKVWGISASVLDKGSQVQRYACRQIARAKEHAIDPWLQKMNDEYAMVNLDGKARIVQEVPDLLNGRSKLVYQDVHNFSQWMANQFIETTVGDKVQQIPVVKWWISHPKRRQYRSVAFNPGKDIPGVYNLWTGFSVDARPGNCQMFLDHVYEQICSQNDDHFRYLMGWMARAVQKPDEPGHSSVVLRGRQGTGKGAFAHTFGHLFGRHYLHLATPDHLFGRFNSYMEETLLLFVDEAFWAGSKKQENMLKALVTEPTLRTEGKGLEVKSVRNHLHIIMASNEEWVVPASLDDRRFLVLDVSPSRMQESEYFAKMAEQMRTGGYEALLHKLLTHDLSQFNIRSVPKTRALGDQKLRSMSPEMSWWYQKLEDGRVLDHHGDWSSEVFASELVFDFASYIRTWGKGHLVNPTRLGMFLKSVLPTAERRKKSGSHAVVQMDGTLRTVDRPYIYLLPSLQDCRKHWDDNFGGPYPWPKIEEENEAPSNF